MLVVGVAVAWAVAPRAIMVGLLPLVYVLGPLAYRCRPAAAWAGLAAALGVVWLLGRPGGAIVFTVAFTPVWTVAYAARLHRVHTERLMAEHALRGLAEQRLRIARELHDIVAHGMSVITVQAGYGALVIDDQPGEARAALEAIETTGRRTLVEMRHLLGALRTDDGVDLEPVPALDSADDLDTLLERTASAGVRVHLRVCGAARSLPAGAGLTAYRVVQESLTNVVKHASAATARLTLDYRDDALVIEVTDPGVGCARPPRLGHGLLGMRERVRLYGGTMEAGPLPDGGFRVLARLPAVEAEQGV